MKYTFLATLLFVLAPSLRAAETVERPNIVFILADDVGFPDIGCYGGKFKTPQIDALAKSGIRFDHAFSAPLCAPSRAMLMSGRYAFRTGVTNNDQGGRLTPQKDGCVAKVLKDAGYATGVAGKWHQLSHFTTKEDGARWGFDEFMTWGNGGAEGADKKGKGDRYWSPDYNLNGKALQDKAGKYGPDVLQEFAVDFIRRHKDGPFFLYYPMPLVHAPILPTPDSPKGQGKGKKKNPNSLYADNVAYMDKLVGKLVAELDTLKIREKTLVLYVGDNGTVGQGMVEGQKLDGGKHSMHEGGSRVPFIASWPGTTPAGVVSHDLVDFTDVLSTFAELGKGKPAAGIKADGHSFAPQLRGEAGSPREWVYVQLNGQYYIRNPKWKLTSSGELFDMKDAPFKEHLVSSVSTDPAAVAARSRLQTAVNALRASEATTTAATMPKKKKKK